MQWTDPLYLAGDWIPEVVTLSAAGDGFTKPGAPSIPVHPADLKRVDIVLFAVCALDLRACQMVVNRFWRQNAHTLRVWTGKLVAVDASRLFSRPALSTVVKSAEVIAEVVADYPIFGHGNSVWKLWTPP